MHTRQKLAAILALPLCLAATGCGPGEEQESIEDERVAQHEQSLYIASTRRWPSNSIPVCWEKSVFAPDETARAWVRGAVESTWGAVSRVDFTGWGTCGWSEPGIRIRVSDEGPHVKQLGNMLNGLRDGMVLNFTFQNWGYICSFTRQDCIEDIAVHEFGHALGFAHEQNRPDTPSSCVDEEQGENGDTLYGDWDLNSVMNYCNPEWNGDGLLSAYDTWGVQWAYRQNGNPVALRSHAGHYVMADGSVSATSATVNHMENLNLIDLGGGKVVLQAMNGHYLSAENGGGGFVYANRPAVGAWETFTLVNLGNGQVALRAYNGQYLVAENGGGGAVYANRNAIGPWETFTLMDL